MGIRHGYRMRPVQCAIGLIKAWGEAHPMYRAKERVRGSRGVRGRRPRATMLPRQAKPVLSAGRQDEPASRKL